MVLQYFQRRRIAANEEREAMRRYALTLVAKHNVPDPPPQYCVSCGAELSWAYTKAIHNYFGKYNPDTGEKRFIIHAKFTCPVSTSHNLGDAFWDGVYWTDARRWSWKTPYELTTMGR